MKSVVFRLASNGTISTESLETAPVNFADRLIRLRERRDPLGILDCANMRAENDAINAEVASIQTLRSIASSLESLTEVMDNLLEANGMSPENIQRFELLANEIAGPLGEDPILLTDAQGVATTESIVEQAQVAFASVIAGVDQLVNRVSQYYLRYRGLASHLRRQLMDALTDLEQIKYTNPIEIIPSAGMSGLCSSDGSFELGIALTNMRALTENVRWVINTLAPDTVNLLEGVVNWLDGIEVDDDNAVDRTVSTILDLKTPVPPSDWTAVPPNSMTSVTQSQLLFDNYCFTATRPSTPSNVDTEYLTRDIMASEITFDPVTDSPVVADDAVVTIDSVDSVIRLINDGLEILDLQDIFNLHHVRMIKALYAMIEAGKRLMVRSAAAADGLSEASLAKLVLAIQSPQAISLKALSPYRDVLYESSRVVIGVISLANAVKTAESSAE